MLRQCENAQNGDWAAAQPFELLAAAPGSSLRSRKERFPAAQETCAFLWSTASLARRASQAEHSRSCACPPPLCYTSIPNNGTPVNVRIRSKHVKRIQAGRPCGYHTSITVQSARCGHWGRKCAVHPAPQPMPCCPDRHVLQPESGEPQPPGHSGPGGGLSGQGPNWPALQRSSWPQAALPLGCPAAIVPHLPDAGIEQAKSLTHRELSTVLHGNGGKAGEPPRSQAFSKPACRTEMGSAQATHTVTFTGDVPSTRRHSHTPSPCKRPPQKGIKKKHTPFLGKVFLVATSETAAPPAP